MVKKAKKILALCLAFAMLFACMTLSANATTDQYFTITESATAGAGSSFSLTVGMNDVKLLKGVQGTVNFDAAVLTLDSVTAPESGGFAQTLEGEELLVTNIDNTAGTVNFLAAREEAYGAEETASPAIMVLNFTVKADADEDDYDVYFSNEIAAKENGVYVEELGVSQSAIVTVSNAPLTPDVTADDIKNQIVGFDPLTMEYAVSTDDGQTYGLYTSEALAMKYSGGDITVLTGNKKVKVRFIDVEESAVELTFTPDFGDVDGSGVIDIFDVLMAQSMSVGLPGFTPEQISRAIVSNKTADKPDIFDVLAIQSRSVNIYAPWVVEVQD